MGKAMASDVAARAAAATNEGISYEQMDCQAFIEYVVNSCGGEIDFSGSNDMARHACDWVEPLADARQSGRLVPGTALFIKEPDDSGLPQRYKGDGLGNFSHVGLYIGSAYGLRDVDKQGRLRACDVVHSGASMGRVSGSTLGNGWTHAGKLSAVDYGGGEQEPAGADEHPSTENLPCEASQALVPHPIARVSTPDQNPVKIRANPSSKCALYKKLANGSQVLVLKQNCGTDGGWTQVQSGSRKWYVMSCYLSL